MGKAIGFTCDRCTTFEAAAEGGYPPNWHHDQVAGDDGRLGETKVFCSNKCHAEHHAERARELDNVTIKSRRPALTPEQEEARSALGRRSALIKAHKHGSHAENKVDDCPECMAKEGVFNE